MSVTQEIKSRLDIVDVVSETVSLRKSGRNFAGFCPFHHNTRTPSFYVFPDTQTWHCFGACAEGGDLFSFVMKQQGLEFKEALKELAQRAGVTLAEHQPVDKVRRSHEDKLTDLLSAAADYFHQLLLHAPQAKQARQYITDRGLTAETQAAFRLGFALDSWDACRTHFNAQGYSDQELLEVGLLSENPEKGTKYDRFRHRLMIPIRDMDGRLVGFGARTLVKDGIPKYLNSPQTALFDKSRLLYGLDMAKRDIREARQAVIVEGYMDVMQAWQAGFRNVVAQMGTALTEAQLHLLKRYTKRFVLALDADAAGAQATMRSLQVARETLDREVEVKFDARGLVQHEGRLKADIRIATMPLGKDPDNIIQANPAEWTRLVAAARPVVMYVIDVATHDLDMSDAKAKTAVAQRVIPLIKDIVDPVERDHYWQQLAQALQVDERSLRQIRLPEKRPYATPSKQVDAGPKIPNGQKRATPAVSTGAASTQSRETFYLCQCLHHPQVMVQVNQMLAQVGQPVVNQEDFSAAEDRELIQQMYYCLRQTTVVAGTEMWDSLDKTLQERVQSLLLLSQIPEMELDRLADRLVLSVLDWRLRKVQDRLDLLKQLFPKTQRDTEPEIARMYDQQAKDSHIEILHLNKAKNALTATGKRQNEELMNG